MGGVDPGFREKQKISWFGCKRENLVAKIRSENHKKVLLREEKFSNHMGKQS